MLFHFLWVPLQLLKSFIYWTLVEFLLLFLSSLGFIVLLESMPFFNYDFLKMYCPLKYCFFQILPLVSFQSIIGILKLCPVSFMSFVWFYMIFIFFCCHSSIWYFFFLFSWSVFLDLSSDMAVNSYWNLDVVSKKFENQFVDLVSVIVLQRLFTFAWCVCEEVVMMVANLLIYSVIVYLIKSFRWFEIELPLHDGTIFLVHALS